MTFPADSNSDGGLWTVGEATLRSEGISVKTRQAAAELRELELRFGMQRYVSPGLTVLDCFVPDRRLTTTARLWQEALARRYPAALRFTRAKHVVVSNIDVDAARLRLRDKLLPAARFGTFLDGDEFEATPQGEAARVARDALFDTWWSGISALCPTDAPLLRVEVNDSSNENTEHELTVLANAAVVIVAVRSFAM